MRSAVDNGKQKCHQRGMKSFVILLNGELTVTDRLKKQVAGGHVVAADGGMRHAEALGVEPVCWIGDFDSSDEALRQKWPDVPRQVHPTEKNMTDGELAIRYALENGAEEIVLVAGIGGQSDQTISHVSQLIKLARQDVRCFASSGTEEAWPLQVGSFLIDLPTGTTLSVVGMSPLERLSIRGVKWELESVDVDFGSTLTMSNKVAGIVSIVLCGGCGVVLVKNVA